MALLQTLQPIKLTRKKTGLAALVEKKTFLGRVARVITSPKTTLVLGATLASLLNPAAASLVARKVGTTALGVVKKRPITSLAVAGILTTSPKAREFIVQAPKRIFTGGQKIGKIIEDPSKAEDVLGIKKGSTFKEKALTGLKAAGIVGLGVGAVLGTKALLEKRKAKEISKLPGLKQVGFTEPRPVGLGGVPVAIQPQIQPVGRPGEPLTKMPVSNIIQIQVH